MVTEDPTDLHDLIIVGGSAAGLSVAISAKRSGIDKVRIIANGPSVAFDEFAEESGLNIGYDESVTAIDANGDNVSVVTDKATYLATGCLIASRKDDPQWSPPITFPTNPGVAVDSLPEDLAGKDLLIVGQTDNAVELAYTAASEGATVVVSAKGMDPGSLSPAAGQMLRRLERERRATVLYRSAPKSIAVFDECPVAVFEDRRVPDLEFDSIVFASEHGPATSSLNVTPEAMASGRVILIDEPNEDTDSPVGDGWQVSSVVANALFPEIDFGEEPTTSERRRSHVGAIEQLRDEYYNATITHFEPTHSDLWVLRVKPDVGEANYKPGQYATLGLGFWEDRVDDAVDIGLDGRWHKLIRRSYSISHPIFEESGYLAHRSDSDELEFYIVLVPPTADNIPALTPRLALKAPGDRIFLGAKVTGRYTLEDITDPDTAVVFLSTGTGEAPHNAMVAELLQKGHQGPIVSAVTVRRWADLGYMDAHRKLENNFDNYHYLPLPTRETDVEKRYLQDLLGSGDIESAIGQPLNPKDTHFFLCGNPDMIGLPEKIDGNVVFPETTGVVEILTDRGFTLAQRGVEGNIHYEEYW